MTDTPAPPIEINCATLSDYRSAGRAHRVFDVREAWEIEICAFDDDLKIPMTQIPGRLTELPRDGVLVVLCH